MTISGFKPNKVFTAFEVVDFCSAYCLYFKAIGDMLAAEPYYQVLDTIADENPTTRVLIQDIVFEKLKFLNEE